MRHYCLVRGRLNKVVSLAAIFLLTLAVSKSGAQSQAAPAITVTVNKSMVFRLAERAKRVSVSQPEVADVLVVAPSQLLINGKNVGTTSLIIFDEKGEVSNYDLIVAPDISALRGQLRAIFPNEKVDISTSGPSLVLRGEVSNEVVYDRVLEVVATYLPPKPPATVAPSTSTIFYPWSESSRHRFRARELALPVAERWPLPRKHPSPTHIAGVTRKKSTESSICWSLEKSAKLSWTSSWPMFQ